MLVLRKDDLDKLFISIILILYPINIEIVSSIRPVDIFILLFFCYRIFRENEYTDKSLMILSFIFFIFLLSSTIYGFIFREVQSLTNIFFIQKFLFPFLLFFSIKNSQLTEKEVRFTVKVFIIVYLFMLVWTLLYQPLRFMGVIRGSWRTTYPFSNRRSGSDAHMLSYFFSFHIVLLFVCWRLNVLKMNRFLFTLIIIASIGAMLITGSRNGIVSVGITTIYILIRCNNGLFRFNKRLFTVIVLMILISVIGIFVVLNSNSDIFTREDGIQLLLERAFKLDFANDMSANGRIIKFNYALEEVLSSSVVFGIGAFTSKLIWFDGAIPSIIVNSGFGGLLILSMIIAVVIVKNKRKAFFNENQKYQIIYEAVFMNVIISNIVTEFFLVTRGMVFSIYILAILEKITNIKSFEFKVWKM